MLGDKQALAAKCQASAGYDRPVALYRACFSLERGDAVPYWIAYGDTARSEDPLYRAAVPHAAEVIADLQRKLAAQPASSAE
jgi:hypothetical protein